MKSSHLLELISIGFVLSLMGNTGNTQPSGGELLISRWAPLLIGVAAFTATWHACTPTNRRAVIIRAIARMCSLLLIAFAIRDLFLIRRW